MVRLNILTQMGAKNLGPGKHSDGQGLWLVKRNKENGKWIVRLVINGKRREMGLGRWPDVSIGEARERASQARKTLRDGLDPIVERERLRRTVNRLTIRQAILGCFTSRKAQLKGEGEAGGWMSPLNVHVIPKVGDQPIEQLDQHLGAERRDVRREVSLNAIANSLDRSSIRLDELAADSRLSPSGELHASERVRALADQIAELPPDYRQVILLRNFEGLPFAEVAICVDRSQGATRMLWLRAVEMLRKRLTSKGLV